MKINFTKMHGLGNDFVVMDAISQPLSLTPAQIRFIADRHFGVGCDQLLLVEKPISDTADFKYRIFNADGSEVAQCGNGARCFARFVRDKHLTHKDEICVDTDSGQLILTLTEDGLVTVNMGIPRHAPAQIPLLTAQETQLYQLTVEENPVSFGAVSMGNPHAVMVVPDVKTAPVNELGAKLESHPFFPQRANIGFMEIVDRQKINLRVFERGTGETMACGSGACAAVVVGYEQGLLDETVNVNLPGGELIIRWQGRGTAVFMTGAAVGVFEGQIDL
jgi:diaminopimelate epimerase